VAKALVLLAAVVAAAGLLGGCSGDDAAPSSTTIGTAPPVETTTTTEPPLEAGTQIFVYIPKTGDCFDRRKIPGQNKKQTEVVLKLDCQLPHRYEVYATVDAPINKDDRSYPGDEALRSIARVECPKQYLAYIGQTYELSKYEIGYVIPPEANWPNNHTIGCYVVDPTDQKLVGTVKGAKS